MLSLWCGWRLIFLLIVLHSLGLWCLLLGLGLWLLLLLWWRVYNSLLDQSGLSVDGGEDLLVGDGLEPASGRWVLCAPFLVENEKEPTGSDASGVEIGQRKTLTNEVCVGGEVVLEDADAVCSALLVVFDVLLVVRCLANQRAEPATESWQELGGGE